jgi:methyl-accepting chemotaxis protein
MRSAEAAKNTSSLIEQSVTNAKNGVSISAEVAQSLGEITSASEKMNNLVNEIAVASREQSQGIGQVNTAVGQMDKVTQATAANAEESAAAAEELSAQAQQMAGAVRELLALVGSAVSSAGNKASAPKRPAVPAKPTPPEAHAPSRHRDSAAAFPLDQAEEAAAGFDEFGAKSPEKH